MSDSLQLACACARAADDIKAENIRVMDLRGISSLADYMVICSGTSMPHLRGILRDIEGDVQEWLGAKAIRREGRADTQWVVLDYIDVMVHIMEQEVREFYGLEDLWRDAAEVDWSQWQRPAPSA